MTAATERIAVHVTLRKKSVLKKSKGSRHVGWGIHSTGTLPYCTPEEEVVLDQMIQQMNKSTKHMGRVVDDALASIAASNQRINAMEKKAT